MNNIRKLFQLKTLLFFVLVFSVLLLIVDTVLKTTKKAQPEKQTIIPERPILPKQLQAPETIQFSLSSDITLSTLEQLSVYTNQSRQLFSTQEIEHIALGRNLTPSKKVPFLWSTGNDKIYYNPQEETIIESTQIEKTNTIIDHDLAKTIAMQFLEERGINWLKIDETKTQYYQSRESEPMKTTKEEANLVRFVFVQQINEVPAILGLAQSPAEIWIASPGIVTKATYQNLAFSPQKIGEGQVLTKEEVLTQLNSGLFSITAIAINKDLINTADLSSVKLMSCSIEYRQHKQESLLPFYVCTGTGYTQSNQNATVKVITPAIKTENLTEKVSTE